MERKHHMLSMEPKILKTLEKRENFTKLLDAVRISGLEEELNSSGPFTLFAPTDNAFLNMPPGLMDTLMMDKSRIAEVVKHHIVADQIGSADAIHSKNAMALDGEVLNFETCNGFKIGDAAVVEADVECRNGLVQVIDHVLLPQVVENEHNSNIPHGGDIKMVPHEGKMDKAMSSGSQKMQEVKEEMKEKIQGSMNNKNKWPKNK